MYSFNYGKDSIKADFNKLFTDKIKNNLIRAEWYSGLKDRRNFQQGLDKRNCF